MTGAVQAGDLRVHVMDAADASVKDAVISLHPAAGTPGLSTKTTAVMDQRDLRFVPFVLPVQVGTSVTFPNSDNVRHHVYSFSPAKRFEMRLYAGNHASAVSFDQPGIVTLGCNIHDAMLAYILVTDASYYGQSAADGTWAQTDVARGRYRVEVWSPRLAGSTQTLEQEITVNTGDHVQTELRADRPLRPAPVNTHPHSWDAY